MKARNQPVRIRFNFRVRHLEQLPGEAKKFPGGQLVVKKWKIGDVGDFTPCFERLLLHVETANARGAGSRLHQAGKNFQRGCFSGGVRAEHGEKFSAGNGELHIVDGDEIAEFLHEIDNFNHDLPHPSISAVSPPGSSTRMISPSVLT